MLERKLKKAIAQILLTIAIATVTIISIPAGKVYASTLEPANDQKIEYRAISQEVVNGKKQLIIEVRIRKLKFKGIDLRLQYNTRRFAEAAGAVSDRRDEKQGEEYKCTSKR